MDERAKIILSEFADWAIDCRNAYDERYEDSKILETTKELTRIAKEALLKHYETDILRDYAAYQDTRDTFLDASYQYFRLRVSEGYEATESAIWELNQQEGNWTKIKGDIQNSLNLSEIKQALKSNCLKIPLLSESKHSFAEIQNDALKTIETCRQSEHDSRYGQSAVFERLGKAYAEKIIADQLPKKRGAPKKSRSPDTYRSFQFGKIVDRVSNALQGKEENPTTAHELCHLLLGDEEQVSSFDRKEEIKWAMKHYFRASNMTPNGFLNSISRGKGNPLVTVVSRIK